MDDPEVKKKQRRMEWLAGNDCMAVVQCSQMLFARLQINAWYASSCLLVL